MKLFSLALWVVAYASLEEELELLRAEVTVCKLGQMYVAQVKEQQEMVEDISPLAFKLSVSLCYKPEGASADDQGPTKPPPVRRGSTIANRGEPGGAGLVLTCPCTSRV